MPTMTPAKNHEYALGKNHTCTAATRPMVIVIHAARRMETESRSKGPAHFHTSSFWLISLLRMLMRVSTNSVSSCFVSSRTAPMDFSCPMVRPPQPHSDANTQPHYSPHQHSFSPILHTPPLRALPRTAY